MKDENVNNPEANAKLYYLEKAYAASQISESDYLMWKKVYTNFEKPKSTSKKPKKTAWKA